MTASEARAARRAGRIVPATGLGRAHGTFGELLQGALAHNGEDFLVSLPIDAWSTARFDPGPGGLAVDVEPRGKEKSRRLAEAVLRALGEAPGGRLTIDSAISVGKGLASSTADMVATARAVSAAFGAVLEPADIARMLCAIEPSDGVMYDGLVAFAHRRGRLRARIGGLPPLTIVGVDEGSTIDTVTFNRVPKPFTDDDRIEYTNLLGQLLSAVRRRDLHGVGRVATRSAVMNQRVRRSAILPGLLALREQTNALGVVLAHSGTYAGLLFDGTDACGAERGLRAAALRFGEEAVTVFATLPATAGAFA